MRSALKLSNIIPISVLATGGNAALPTLPAAKAVSSWAMVLMALSVVCNAAEVDLFAVFADMGLGATPEEVIANGDRAVSAVQQLMPLVFGTWAWIERRAPKFRLTFWGRGA